MLIRRKPLRRYTRLRPVSARRERQAADWELCKKAVAERENWKCENCGYMTGSPRADTCWGVLDFHHVIPRSRAPKRVCDPDNVVLIHRSFHSYIHEHPDWARANGWLK